MTDDRADVIEAAAKVLREMTYETPYGTEQHGTSHHYDSRCPWCLPDVSHGEGDGYTQIARALSAAGLLVSPADQDAMEALSSRMITLERERNHADARAQRADREAAKARAVTDYQRTMLAEVRAEVERLRRWKDEASPVMIGLQDDAVEPWANAFRYWRKRALDAEAERGRWKAEALPALIGLQDLGKALGVPLGKRITGEAAAEQARALKAERDAALRVIEVMTKAFEEVTPELHLLRAQVAAVRALHKRQAFHDGDVACEEDAEYWPCDTIRALDTAGEK